MSSFVTQCPHCQTCFRVSRTQLAAAQGVVRCGACMELFNAARHLRDADMAGSEASPEATRLTAASQALNEQAQPGRPADQDDTVWIHDDLDLDSLVGARGTMALVTALVRARRCWRLPWLRL